MILSGKQLFLLLMFTYFNFVSEKYCINLNIPMKSIEENDAEIFHKKIDQDRIMVIQVRNQYFVILIFH